MHELRGEYPGGGEGTQCVDGGTCLPGVGADVCVEGSDAGLGFLEDFAHLWDAVAGGTGMVVVCGLADWRDG